MKEPEVTTAVRLPKTLYKALKIRAIEEERPLHAVIRDALERWMRGR